MNTEHKRKISEAAKKRWARMGPEEAAQISNNISDALKEFWAGKSKEERLARARKAAATRRANQKKRSESK